MPLDPAGRGRGVGRFRPCAWRGSVKFGPGARGRGPRGAGSAVRDACGGRAAALAQGGEWGPAGLTSQESVAERLSSISGGECCEGAARRRVRAPAPDSDSPRLGQPRRAGQGCMRGQAWCRRSIRVWVVRAADPSHQRLHPSRSGGAGLGRRGV
jgi:hypothetical protein